MKVAILGSKAFFKDRIEVKELWSRLDKVEKALRHLDHQNQLQAQRYRERRTKLQATKDALFNDLRGLQKPPAINEETVANREEE